VVVGRHVVVVELALVVQKHVERGVCLLQRRHLASWTLLLPRPQISRAGHGPALEPAYLPEPAACEVAEHHLVFSFALPVVVAAFGVF
jgi:hypothetical protein